MSERSDTAKLVCAAAVVCLFTVAVYGQVWSFEFINYDDQHFIITNQNVTGGLNAENALWAFTTSKMGIWHPLTWLSYQLEVSAFGADSPGVHHGTNMLLHLLNALLVFVICLRLSGAVWPSMVVAILFSVHPQHVQPVAWISERKELLAATFFLVSIYFYLLYRCFAESRRYFMLSLLAFLLALLCKPSVTPLPVVLVIIDVFYRPDEHARGSSRFSWNPPDAARLYRLLASKVPFFLLALIVSAIAVYIKKTGPWAEYEETFHLARRLLLMPIGLLHYVKAFFVPWPNPIWIEPPAGMPLFRSLLALILLSGLGYAAWFLRHRFPELLFGALWFVVMWLPVSGIVIVSKYYVADRYTYLPYIGALFGIVFCAARATLSLKHGQKLASGLALLAVFSSAALAYKQTGYWRNGITFFSREADINPTIPSAPLLAAYALFDAEQNERALEMTDRSLELDDDNAKAHALRGDVLRTLGKKEQAVSAYEEAVSREVDRADTYVHLGILRRSDGLIEESAGILESGLERFPDDIHLLNHLAHLYAFSLGRADTSRNLYNRALEIDADSIDARLGLGILSLREGREKEGMVHLEQVLQIDPGNQPALTAIKTYYGR